jgi:hypothetical protein
MADQQARSFVAVWFLLVAYVGSPVLLVLSVSSLLDAGARGGCWYCLAVQLHSLTEINNHLVS